ncbi:MAG TPA: ribosome-associated translation inhibitor RaiA [Mariprofundaceae bacterium]|nr:ribosome-associated translation inhibitor RaiA [Mariprofundaceae bacterium]
MQVSITGRNMELTEPLKAYVDDKLQHLKHSFDHVVDVHVVLSVQKFHHQCEMTVQASGMVVHAKHDSEDMYASIDGVVDKLNRQLKRYRAKMHRHQTNHAQRKGREIKVSHRVVSMPPHEELAADQQPETVHHEEMAAKPMSVDEAVMQMELSEQQPLIVFTNQETESLNVIYRRTDGQLGWIEPTSS